MLTWGMGVWRRRAALPAVVLAVAGTVGSVVTGIAVAGAQRRDAQEVMDRRTVLVAEAVQTETRRYVDTLRTTAAAVGAFEHLTATKFTQIAGPLSQMQLAGATSLVFVVPATDAQVDATQRRWRDRGVTGLTLRPHTGVGEHLFSVLSRPIDGTAPGTPGVDLAQAPAPAQALAEARRSGQVTVSDTYHLIRDQSLPAAQRQLSFVLTAPVHGPVDATGTRPFRGWLLMGLRGRTFAAATMSRAAQDLIDITLHASTTDGATAQVADLHAPTPGARDLHRRVDVTVAQRRWQLHLHAVAAAMPGSTNAPAATVGGGLLVTILLSALVLSLATGKARAQARVAAATAELRANEVELRRQKADLTAFAGVVAHDLTAPLAAVRGHAEILTDALHDGDDPATMHARVQKITGAATRMGTLIDDLLTYATATDNTLRPVDVNLRELVDEVVIGHLDAAGARGRPLPTVYVGDLPAVHGDPVMLRQLLHNLIGNAIKYTHPGQIARVDVTATTDHGRVQVQIADRGIGIPAGQHEAIFDSFHRAHTDTDIAGTGLGLAICQRVVDRHGGTITAADNPGGGTRITITLPATTASAVTGQHSDDQIAVSV